jgi:F0F1-type ATP synthase membrane subunit b/b'
LDYNNDTAGLRGFTRRRFIYYQVEEEPWLDIEKAAANLHSTAHQQAANLIAEAEKAAASLRESRLEQAHREAEHIIAAGKQQAEAEHARVIAQAGADAQRLDTTAAKNLEHAVDFVLARVIEQS